MKSAGSKYFFSSKEFIKLRIDMRRIEIEILSFFHPSVLTNVVYNEIPFQRQTDTINDLLDML